MNELLVRSRTSDEFTDEIPVQNLATLWAGLKSRRIAIGPV